MEGKLRGEGTEQKGKRTHEHGQQCGDCGGKWGIRGQSGNGKKYNEDYIKRKKENNSK